MNDFLSQYQRTHTCGELRASHEGQNVVLYGWVHNRRDHGGRIFIDLRDREGLTQIVFGPDIAPITHQEAQVLRSEFCIGITGKVSLRTSTGGKENEKLPTGTVEVEVQKLHIFSSSDVPPFPIKDGIETREEIRLKYRYLDLRRPELQKNFLLRHKLCELTRNFFCSHKFVELETPFMGKYTPGGARNFLVPSRQHQGHFYALAESPQIYKQLFMLSGFDRYFQIVRCFRDEDLRMDRQPEFTQIDVEMSFIEENNVFSLIESLFSHLWKEILGQTITTPFERIPYSVAMDLYGEDKPDLRNPLILTDVTQLVSEHKGGGVPFFEQTLAENGMIKLLRLPASAAKDISNTELKRLEQEVKGLGSRGLASARLEDKTDDDAKPIGWTQFPFKTITDSMRFEIQKASGAQPGDLLFFQAGKKKVVHSVLSHLRTQFAKRFSLLSPGFRFAWIVDFPLFDKDDRAGLVSSHHPFTAPKSEHQHLLSSEPEKVLARAYDLVLNGNEIGGGSIRIHDGKLQAEVFSALGMSDEEKNAKFGFLLDAFKYGPPPHGGIAFGLDRLSMLLCEAESLRDVIAFPKTQQGTDLMSECPTPIASSQLQELGIQMKSPVKV